MRIQLIAIICMILIITTPMTLAAETFHEEFDEQDTGESIAVNVKAYEPTIVTSNLIEDNIVPVYVYLAGSTVGTLLGLNDGLEPLYGGIEIEKVKVRPTSVETAEAIEGDIKYYRPNKVEPDTLGYLTFALSQLDREELISCTSKEQCAENEQCDTGVCIPTQVELDFSAEIFYDQAERLYSLSKTGLIIPEEANEREWSESIEENGARYAFYGGRGLVRVRDIGTNTVDVTVYSNKDLYWPIIGSPRPIADLTLQKGQQSDYVDLGVTDEFALRNANFRLLLTDISDPSQSRATIRVNVGGKQFQQIVVPGSALYPGSSWVVEEVIPGRTVGGALDYKIIIQDRKGNKETINTVQQVVNGEDTKILNRKFYDDAKKRTLSDEEIEEGLFFTSATRSINAIPVNQLAEKLEQYPRGDGGRLIVKGDEIQEETKLSKKKVIEHGDTLKEVLVSTLPAGHYYEVDDANTIILKKFEASDPCLRPTVTIYETDSLPISYDNPDGEFVLNLLCSSVVEFNDIVDSYDDTLSVQRDDSIVDNALYGIGFAYEQMVERAKDLTEQERRAAKEKQLEAWQQLVDKESIIDQAGASLQEKVIDLQNELTANIDFGSISVEDNGQFAYVKLITVEELDNDELASAEISKDGLIGTYNPNDKLFKENPTDGTGEYNWFVDEIYDTSVRIKKKYILVNSKKTAKTITETVSLGKNTNIEGINVRLNTVDNKKEAHITVVPGSGTSLRSVSNFSVHIPIEGRGLKLNPDKIDDKIAKAKDLQEKLEKVINTLDEIVTYWNYVCLGVFAFVSIKSSFFSASSEARSDAIYGVDGQSGWNAYCEEQARIGGITFDRCMQDNAANIQDDIKAAQNAKENLDSLTDLQNSPHYNEIASDYQDGDENVLARCQDLVGDQAFMNDQALADYIYLKELQSQNPSEKVSGTVQVGIDSYAGEDSKLQDARAESCKSTITALDNGEYASALNAEKDPKKRADLERQFALGIFESDFQETTVVGGTFPHSETFSALNQKTFGELGLQQVGKVFQDKSGAYKIYTESESIVVEPLTEFAYENLLNKKESQKPVLPDEILATVNQDIGILNETSSLGKNKPVVANSGEQYYVSRSGDLLYVGTAAYSTGIINTKWADGAKFEVYGRGKYKGLPYCIPYDDGNFIKVITYTLNNEIDTLQYWNVGTDGHLCTNDDVLVQHESELEYNTASPNRNTLISFANKYVRTNFVENQIINIFGEGDFRVSFGKSLAKIEGASSSCYDVMDPNDCKILFDFCDPVMCPPSRFNLGGRYNVDNVVESGFIGSVTLGAQTGDVVPVCLTGVLASMNYWNSMLEGYVQCLETAKFEGKTVGICDKIKSVYWCETAVREAAIILNDGQGGLLEFLSEGVYGGGVGEAAQKAGGGEYLRFKENLQNMQNSVSFFTTEYASTAFAAFKGKSLEEVGTEICRQAIYGKMPFFKDFMSQITTPEDPNQFYASLTTRPYAPSQGQEAYQTYYHIYAGVNENIENVVYSVYLRNSQNNAIKYVTEQCDGVSSSIELGEMSDVTMDCIGPEGFDEVCVVINGQTTCGFGTVSTAFSNQFLKDTLVNDEVRRNIETEEQCYPSAPTASPSVSKVGSVGTTENLALPFQFGLLETGVRRVCSLENPGAGQGNKGDWVVVGTCGQDQDGRGLGSCWLDQESYSILDAKRSEEANAYLEEVNLENSKVQEGILASELLGEEQSAEFYTETTKQLNGAKCDTDGKSIGAYRLLPSSFSRLAETTLSPTYEAASKYQTGNVYLNIVTGCELYGRGTPDFEGKVYDARGIDTAVKITNVEEISVPKGSGQFEVIVSNLLKDDRVETGDNSHFPFKCTRNLDKTSFTCIADTNIDSRTSYNLQLKLLDKDGKQLSAPSFLLSSDLQEKDTATLRATSAQACSVCTDTLYGCSIADCHDNSFDCYWDKTLVNECFACGDLRIDSLDDLKAASTAEEKNNIYNTMCSQLSDDRTRCQTSQCTQTFLLDEDGAAANGKCVWQDNSCVYSASGEDPNSEPYFKDISVSLVQAYTPGLQGDEGYLEENAYLALQQVGLDLLSSPYGKEVSVTSSSRDLANQGRLYFKNCVEGGKTSCDPVTCNAIPESRRNVLNGLTTQAQVINAFETYGSETACPHTSGVAVDIWCEDASDFTVDPKCQTELTRLMLKYGFCRLDIEGWHFEWDEKKVSTSSCKQDNTNVYFKKVRGVKEEVNPLIDPVTSKECLLWNYLEHKCEKT
jgi:hypothetical protein